MSKTPRAHTWVLIASVSQPSWPPSRREPSRFDMKWCQGCGSIATMFKGQSRPKHEDIIRPELAADADDTHCHAGSDE